MRIRVIESDPAYLITWGNEMNLSDINIMIYIDLIILSCRVFTNLQHKHISETYFVSV